MDAQLTSEILRMGDEVLNDFAVAAKIDRFAAYAASKAALNQLLRVIIE